VLTWRVPPIDGREVKRSLGALFDSIRRRWGKRVEWLWWLEFQKRGAPHVHILTVGEVHRELATRQVFRLKKGKRKAATVFCGAEVDWLVARWLDILGDDSQAALRFNQGGIWEKWRKVDGAARYAAKEAAHCYQTQIPAEYHNVGAWWHRSRGYQAPVIAEARECGESEMRQALKMDGKLFPVMFGKSHG